MPLDTSILQSDLEFMITDLPITYTYNGTTYTGAKSTVSAEKLFSEYGVRNNYKFSISSAVSNFSNLPEIGDKFVISGVTYRVLNLEIDEANIGVRFDMGDEYA